MDHEPNVAQKRCADCGTLMDTDSRRRECRHCERCFRPASCGHNHDQWPKE